ncbi:Hypothetical predicted protein [Marmota monax]|uniref:ubiquitinyl hydrolase 1 n=1 Tax=Marmota monax TaxID=9995 RepID=A0A5E4CEV9_MARMO|nr:Hypothetical predicted protein [Marmota monax]
MESCKAGEWCLMESLSWVFTELIQGFGYQGAQVEEIRSLEPENFEKLKLNFEKKLKLIFLLKWQPEGPGCTVLRSSDLTRYISRNVHLGETLSEFREFSQSFDAVMKGLAFSNSDMIQQIHHSFFREQTFEFDAKTSAKEEDAFHFFSYVSVDGRLYELDGLREEPIDVVAYNQDDQMSLVSPIIEKRIQKYSEGEIRFNLKASI